MNQMKFLQRLSLVWLLKVHDLLPAFTIEEEKQMEEALLLLTTEQIDILHSEETHIIINGPYGSSKSIISSIKAKMIADNLPRDKLLYYVSYDSWSALPNETQRGNPKIEIYPDEEEPKVTKLSDMINNILKKNKMENQRYKRNNRSKKSDY